jgi:hypothetical protein
VASVALQTGPLQPGHPRFGGSHIALICPDRGRASDLAGWCSAPSKGVTH